MGPKHWFVIECRNCPEKVVLPYRSFGDEDGTRFYWPAGEQTLNFACSKLGFVNSYITTDLRCELRFAMFPVPQGSSLRKIHFKCDHDDCSSQFSVHLKDQEWAAESNPTRSFWTPSRPLTCGNGHSVTHCVPLQSGLISKDLSPRIVDHAPECSMEPGEVRYRNGELRL